MKNKNGGFLQLILLIVGVLVLIKLSGMTFSGLIEWFRALIKSTL